MKRERLRAYLQSLPRHSYHWPLHLWLLALPIIAALIALSVVLCGLTWKLMICEPLDFAAGLCVSGVILFKLEFGRWWV